MIQGSLVKMDGMEAAKGFYGMSPKSNAFIGLIAHGYYFLVGAGAIPSRLFLRENLGERAFSPFAFLLCLFFFAYYFFIPFDEDLFLLGVLGMIGNAGAIQMLGHEPDIYILVILNIFLNPCLWFMVWLSRKGIRHFKGIAKKAKENKIQYSYYRGDGKYFEHRIGGKKWGFDIDEIFLRMVIEPLTIIQYGVLTFFGAIVLGLGIYFWGQEKSGNLGYVLIFLGWSINLGLIIIFSGFCLFLEEFGIMTRIRGAALDLIDGEYDLAFVMKKKEELEKGVNSAKPTEDLNLAEQIYQSDPINMDTVVTMAVPIEEVRMEATSEQTYQRKTPKITPDTDLEIQSLREKLREQFLKSE